MFESAPTRMPYGPQPQVCPSIKTYCNSTEDCRSDVMLSHAYSARNIDLDFGHMLCYSTHITHHSSLLCDPVAPLSGTNRTPMRSVSVSLPSLSLSMHFNTCTGMSDRKPDVPSRSHTGCYSVHCQRSRERIMWQSPIAF